MLLKPGLENFEHYFNSMWDECNCVVVWAFFGIAFLWDWNENWPFPVLVPLLSFPNLLAYWVQHFHSIISQDWNSSTGIPPLALFVVVLSKAHLTSHSRMSGSWWVITPSGLSGSWRSFLYSSSVYCRRSLVGHSPRGCKESDTTEQLHFHFSVYCGHLFLISSASVRSISLLFFTEPIFAWNVPLVSLIFLKPSLVFLILLFSSTSLHWSLRKAFLSLLAILWNSAFRCLHLSFSPLLFASLLFTAICKASPDSHFAFLHFFSMGMVLIPVSYTLSRTSVHSSSGTLSDLVP